MGIRQALADPLQPPECVLGDIAGVDDPHHIAVIQDRRFLDMMIGKHVADGSQIVRQVYRDDGFAGDVPDFAVHQLLQFFVKIHGHKGRRIDVEGMLGGEKPKNISVGDKSDQPPQQDDLQQHQPHVKEDGGFAHLNAPHAGHGVRDRADRRHAQVGFNGNGDPQRHDEEPRHVHQESHENTGFFSCFIFMPLYFRFFIICSVTFCQVFRSSGSMLSASFSVSWLISAKSAAAGWYDIVTRWERRRGRRVASGGFLVELSDNAVEIFEKKEHPLRKL